MLKEKNKSGILIIIAVLIICVGSFVGVSAVSKQDNVAPPPQTTLAPTETPTKESELTSSENNSSTQESTGDLPAIIITDHSEEERTTLPNDSDVTNATDNMGVTEPSAESSTQPSTQPSTKPSTEPSTQPSTQQPTTGVIAPDVENGAVFDEGLAGYQYDPDGNFYYTSTDPWQRYGGYNELYDLGAPLVSIYMDTMRLRFEYGGKDWMIQFWKGQYGYLFVGNEIGVYTKPKDRTVDHYDAASNDEALYMSMTGYRNGEEMYTRDYAKYWWCTGFVPGRLESFADRSEISVSCRITAKDYTMLLAICGALKENGYVLGENFTTSGLDVYITW